MKKTFFRTNFALFSIVNLVFLALSLYILAVSITVYPFMPNHDEGMTRLFLVYTALWIPITLIGVVTLLVNMFQKRFGRGGLVIICLIILYVPVLFLSAYLFGESQEIIIAFSVIFTAAVITYAILLIRSFVSKIKSGKNTVEEDNLEETKKVETEIEK